MYEITIVNTTAIVTIANAHMRIPCACVLRMCLCPMSKPSPVKNLFLKCKQRRSKQN